MSVHVYVYVSAGRRVFCSSFGGHELVFDKSAVDGSYVRIVNLESAGSLAKPLKVGVSQCDQYFIVIVFLIGDDHWSVTFVWQQEDCFEVWCDDSTFAFRDVGFWDRVQPTFLFSSNSFEKCQLLVPSPRWHWDRVRRSSYSIVAFPWYKSPLNTTENNSLWQLWCVDNLVKCFSCLILTCTSYTLRGPSCAPLHVHRS